MRFLLFFLSLFGLIQAETHEVGKQDSIEIVTYRGEGVRNLLPVINEWLVTHYIEFPFLYVAQDEVPPSYTLADEPNAFVLFAEEKGKKVGLLLALPMNSPLVNTNYSPFPVLQEVSESGYDLEKILYVPSFLVAKEERGNQELIERIYQKAVELAKKMGKTEVCYFTTIREADHPLRPIPYIPAEPWEELERPFRSMGITFLLTWSTLQVDGSVKPCESIQALYIQNI